MQHSSNSLFSVEPRNGTRDQIIDLRQKTTCGLGPRDGLCLLKRPIPDVVSTVWILDSRVWYYDEDMWLRVCVCAGVETVLNIGILLHLYTGLGDLPVGGRTSQVFFF